MSDKLVIEELFKIFGPHPDEARRLLEQGWGKADIFEQTRTTIGVQNVNLAIREGETFVVMGLSGSGKSTLVRMLNRLIEPTSGHIYIGGHDITAMRRKELIDLRRRDMTMVFQSFALMPHRTVLENACFGLEVAGIPREERHERALRALEQVGLKANAHSLPSELSGGMQQRVGLARALATEPTVLLMDEAFSALDPLIRRDMQHELVALQQKLKKTILFISHDLDEALNIGDRIVLMKDGAIVQSGTPEEILTQPATEYVERFVESVDISKVLTADHAMSRAKTVAYTGDGPLTALHKMKEDNLPAILVVSPDYHLAGMLTAEAADRARRDGIKRIDQVLDDSLPSARGDEYLHDLVNRLAGMSVPLPVIDDDHKLLGVISKGALLEALAQGGEE